MELKKVHEELTTALANMKLQNSNLVDPTLEKLRKEVRAQPLNLSALPQSIL
jgi:hypothetical protein